MTRDFKVKNHYLAEIDRTEGPEYYSSPERWSWDIYIAADHNKELHGKALAPGKGIEVPWTPLIEADALQEMMEKCEAQMRAF
ncbi:hypothetical protein [Alkalihalobacillus sp. 1P02AB]|uniref:hypothetical protein n=1 Tax=Alkalihalobacillus sp. 1P02AB TaxID=3132260 RepID=UPI0039A4A132